MAQHRRRGLRFLLLVGAGALAILLAWRMLRPRPAPLRVIPPQGEGEESLTGAEREELERVLRQKAQPGL